MLVYTLSVSALLWNNEYTFLFCECTVLVPGLTKLIVYSISKQCN